jgi:hypothetical protein
MRYRHLGEPPSQTCQGLEHVRSIIQYEQALGRSCEALPQEALDPHALEWCVFVQQAKGAHHDILGGDPQPKQSLTYGR